MKPNRHMSGEMGSTPVDGIPSQTGVGQGFMGMLLLGGITSLSEITTVTTASWTGNARLAVNNLLG